MRQIVQRSLLVAAVAFVLGAPAANATAWVATASGTGTDGPLSAEADFTFGAGTLTITITNTLSVSSIVSAGQAVSDLTFTIGNAPGALGVTSASGQLVNIDSSHTASNVSGDPLRWLGQGPNPPNGHGFFSIVGDTVTLEAIGGGQPGQMILPASSTYPNANNGFNNFDPYVDGPAKFTLALPGVNENTTLSDVTFSFGTTPDTFLSGLIIPPRPPVTSVPEPSTLALVGAVLLVLFGVRRLSRA